MKKLVAGFALVAVLGILSYGVASHHVVKTDQGVVVLAKRFLTGADTFVDVREWSSADFDAHPELKRALIDHGYREMLEDLKKSEIKASLDGMREKASDVAGDLAAKVSETAGNLAAEVSEKAGDVAEKIEETVRGDQSDSGHSPE